MGNYMCFHNISRLHGGDHDSDMEACVCTYKGRRRIYLSVWSPPFRCWVTESGEDRHLREKAAKVLNIARKNKISITTTYEKFGE